MSLVPNLIPSFSGQKIKNLKKLTKLISTAFSFGESDEAAGSSSNSTPSSPSKDSDGALGKMNTESQDLLEKMVSFQSFDGSFTWNEDFVQTLGLDFNSLKQEAEKENWDLTAWATALAIAFFPEKLGERKESWELVAAKAKKWISKFADSININSETLIQAAKIFFK